LTLPIAEAAERIKAESLGTGSAETALATNSAIVRVRVQVDADAATALLVGLAFALAAPLLAPLWPLLALPALADQPLATPLALRAAAVPLLTGGPGVFLNKLRQSPSQEA